MAASDKTEKPTPKRRREARRDGSIPRSGEVVSWTALLVATWVAGLTISSTGTLLRDVMRRSEKAISQPSTEAAMSLLGTALSGSLRALGPLVGALLVVGVVGNVAQVGWAPTKKGITPQLKKLNPFTGLKRMFSPNGLWEVGKSALKVALLAGLTWGPLVSTTSKLAVTQLSIFEVAPSVGQAAIALTRRIAFAGLALAAFDYAFQRKRVNKSMAMTKQEVKDEYKQSDGNPHLKSEMRSRQMRMSRNRMIADVPKADVVIVNPTHVAVALRYEAATGAPRVVAKGAGAVADRIRAVAIEAKVPLVADIPLARTIFRACEIGQEIPPELYEAVARVLAFVFTLKARPLVTSEPYRIPGGSLVPA